MDGLFSSVENPLTGALGIYAPAPIPWGTGERPLPNIAPAVDESPCVLCLQLSPGSGLVDVRPNPSPLGPNHSLISFREHIEAIGSIGLHGWSSFLGAGFDLARRLPGGVFYGNLGRESGASQPHLHGHAIDLSGAAQGEPGLSGSCCALCGDACPDLSRRDSWRIAFLPGANHGEVLIAPSNHSDRLAPEYAADGLLEVVAAFSSAGWTSVRVLFHGLDTHEHLHVQPAITAGGALEGVLGLPVSRWGLPHLGHLWKGLPTLPPQ